ncbi:hypothetical protein B0T20DRAFT_391327 [Sordaria brevicollis]|uniref:Uncharacterized protein n=1 Tax=Sordaria brevicollis TaxID=83679 RepID=A0AAE0PH65_SORBR|nr:hypothetical protein B0T20DRAFT_391327 [Sordaria brevicollis]
MRLDYRATKGAGFKMKTLGHDQSHCSNMASKYQDMCSQLNLILRDQKLVVLQGDVLSRLPSHVELPPWYYVLSLTLAVAFAGGDAIVGTRLPPRACRLPPPLGPPAPRMSALWATAAAVPVSQSIFITLLMPESRRGPTAFQIDVKVREHHVKPYRPPSPTPGLLSSIEYSTLGFSTVSDNLMFFIREKVKYPQR